MNSRKCTACLLDLPLSQFRSDARGRLGTVAECKACEKARQYAWRKTPAGKASVARSHAKRKADKRQQEIRKAWSTSDAGRAARKKYKESEKGIAAQRRESRSEAARKRRARYAKSPKGKAAIRRAYMSPTGRARLARGVHKRRHRLMGTVSTLTAGEWEAIKETFGHRCVFCGTKRSRLTMDHVIPLSKGGAHSKDNIVPACRKCNAKKGARKGVPMPFAQTAMPL